MKFAGPDNYCPVLAGALAGARFGWDPFSTEQPTSLIFKELKHGGSSNFIFWEILKMETSTFKPYLPRTGLRDPSRKFRRIFSMVKLGIALLWLITGSSYCHVCVFGAVSYHFSLFLNIHSKNKCNRMGWRTIKCNRMGWGFDWSTPSDYIY